METRNFADALRCDTETRCYRDFANKPSFGPGTLIMTTDGALPVEWIVPGDMVVTRSHGVQPLRRIDRFRISSQHLAQHPDLRPLTIAAGGFGNGMPNHPLCVTPKHRICLSGQDIALHFGREAVFATAKDLKLQPARNNPNTHNTYHQLLFDEHEVICANGLWTESIFLDEQVKSVVSENDQNTAIEISHARTALHCLTEWEVAVIAVLRGFQAPSALQDSRAA